jgi:hypothetical protein
MTLKIQVLAWNKHNKTSTEYRKIEYDYVYLREILLFLGAVNFNKYI